MIRILVTVDEFKREKNGSLRNVTFHTVLQIYILM